MFGHSSNDVNGSAAAEPVAGALDHQGQTITPTTTSAPTVDNNDMPGDYVMTDLPHVTEPAAAELTAAPAPAPAATTITVVPPVSADGSDDLLELKQSALQELSPLIGHLEQTPEEKFRTTMMMIQASDNQAMLRDALQAAKEITDEKVRAQALLDVVNEINYFTQQADGE